MAGVMTDDPLDMLVQRARPGFRPRAFDKVRVRRALAGKLAAGGGAIAASTLTVSAWASKLALVAALSSLGAVGLVWSLTTPRTEVPPSPRTTGTASALGPQANVIPRLPEPLPIAVEDLPLAAGSAESPAFRADDPSTLTAEAALVLEARAALRNRQAARVLSLLAGYEARFAEGAMRQEVYGMRILALCDLGRTSEAGKAAQRFVARWPSSPIVARLATSCVGPLLDGR